MRFISKHISIRMEHSWVAGISLLLIAGFEASAQQLPIPSGHSVVDSVRGDLDGRAGSELAVVYNTRVDSTGEGSPRRVVIYRLHKGRWKPWKQSDQALFGSADGGMRGDPFSGIEITNRNLLLYQDGGSQWRWGQTEVYRFDKDDFYLVEYSDYFGKACEDSTAVFYSQSADRISVLRLYEDCTDEVSAISSREEEEFGAGNLRISFAGRQERKIFWRSPRYGILISLARGPEEN